MKKFIDAYDYLPQRRKEMNKIRKNIVDTVTKAHRNLGPSLFESVYRVAMEYGF